MSLPPMKTVFSAGVLSLAILVGAAVEASAESVAARENLQKLINTRGCPGCDLADLNLTRLDLSATNLQGADLSRSRMHLTNLAGANLQKSDLRGAQFGGADLGDADLRGADLRGANLDGAYLAGAQLDGDFVSARSYADLGAETAQEVYVEDPVKPKKVPEAGEVNLAERRDLAEPPPELAKPRQTPAGQIAEARQEEKPIAMPPSPPPEAPAVKKVQPPAPVERAAADKPVAPATPALPLPPAAPAAPAALEEVPPSVALALDKGRRDLLDRLLDSNVCTGCALGGVDLSGRNLKKADLERADLRGANLAKANLEG
ncbi:MAG: pentapeptide repeat-containing protein, partial [Desulforhopalus sp.]|nr:pentapeptide repeat-containing protein [Desulforhopalus sp.]